MSEYSYSIRSNSQESFSGVLEFPIRMGNSYLVGYSVSGIPMMLTPSGGTTTTESYQGYRMVPKPEKKKPFKDRFSS